MSWAAGAPPAQAAVRPFEALDSLTAARIAMTAARPTALARPWRACGAHAAALPEAGNGELSTGAGWPPGAMTRPATFWLEWSPTTNAYELVGARY